MDLISYLKRPEGKTLEFKRDLSSPDGVLRTITAFSNTSGGILLIGIEDKTKSILGISKPLEMEERLANLISDRIDPRLLPELEILPWRKTHILAVQIHPSSLRPHALKYKGGKERIYVRVGSTNRIADQAIVDEMVRSVRSTGFDEGPLLELNSEALDFRAASEFFSEVRKLRRADLETLNLITDHQGQKVPTVGGVLLFGKNRLRHFPDAWIQVGRFQGRTRTRIIDQDELRGYPVEAIYEAIHFVRKHSHKGAEIGEVKRKDRWSIPPLAVREALINAVVHADYSQRGAPIRLSLFDDRLEIESPGLLPFGLTIDDLKMGVSKLRNRVIGRVFHSLGLIEQWGSGIGRMMEACHSVGLPTPVLEEVGTHFRVTIFLATGSERILTEKDLEVLDALSPDNGRLTSEVAKIIGLSTRATRTRLASLVERGLVHEIGTGPQDPKRKYFRTD